MPDAPQVDGAAPAIRAARDGEIDQVGALWGEMYEYQRAQGMLLPLRDDAVDIYKRELVGRLDGSLSTVLVAEGGDGRLAGFLAAQTKRLPAHLAVDNPKIGYISAVYVTPEARRHHLGRALVEAAFAWFARAGVGSIELQVIYTNALAKAFWESVGFRPEILQMRRL